MIKPDLLYFRRFYKALALVMVMTCPSEAGMISQNLLKMESVSPVLKMSEVLKRLKDHYRVEILFNDQQIESLAINEKELDFSASIEHNLLTALKGTGLEFRKVRDRSYLITGRRRDTKAEASIAPDQSLAAVEPTTPVSTEVVAVDRIITGRITDDKGDGLPGVSILLKGSQQGASSNENGKYELRIPDGEASLIFSFVGYLTQEVPVGNKSVVDLVLKVDEKALEEVVVIGYGVQKKRDLTGSVSSIKSEDIERVPVLGLDQAMQGRAPGVFVSNNNANPGGAVNIRIRGVNSIQGNNEPLYVIDGYIGGNINSVNPTDIESIEVLKDASSTAIYGARGANGVVLVTTKGGKEGKGKISFDALYGFQSVRNKIDMMGARDYAGFVNKIDQDRGEPVTYPDPNNLEFDTDWQDAILQTAPWQQYSVSGSGGVERMKYYVSGSYVNQQGVIKETGYDRFNIRANIDSKVSDMISFGTRLGFSRINRTQQQGEEIGRNDDTGHPVGRSLSLQPTVAAFDQEGNALPTVVDFNNTMRGNPLFDLQNIYQKLFSTNFTGTLFAEFNFTKSLKFRTSFGFDVLSQKNNRYKPSTTFDTNAGYRNTASVGTLFTNGWLTENYLTFNQAFGVHSIQAVGGATIQGSNTESTSISVSDFAVDDFQFNNLAAGSTVNSYGTDMNQWRQASFFGRVHYTLKDKYLFTFNARYDGSSKFGRENKWGLFPSGAVAWRLSDEDFIKRMNVFSDMKLRASYGVSGSEALAPYRSLAVMDATSSGYIIGDAQVVGYYASQLANPDLRWEQTAQLDIGLDFGIYNGRLNFVVDYFNKTTKDLFLDKPVPKTSGVSTIKTNIGSLRNSGWELGINATPVSGALKWRVDLNANYQKSEILSLGDQQQIVTGNVQGGYGNIDGIQLMKVGQPLGALYGYKTDGVWGTGEDLGEYTQFGTAVKAGDQKFVDDGDGNVNADDRQILGYAQPKFYGGINNSLTFKGIDLSVFFQFVTGNKVLNGGAMAYRNTGSYSNKHVDLKNAWTPENQDTDIPRAGSNMQRQVMDYYLEDGSFLRMREVTLGYNLPQALLKKARISRLRLYATCTNLLTFTRYSGYDPEVNIAGGSVNIINFDNGSYPRAKTAMLGLNLTF